MTSVDLLRTCFVTACANTLFTKFDSAPLNHKAAVVARRTTRFNAAPSPHRFRRHSPAAASTTTPSAANSTSITTTAASARRLRTAFSAYHPASLRKPSLSFNVTTPKLQTRRAELTRYIPGNMDEMVLLQRSLDESRRNGASTPEERAHPGHVGSRDDSKPRRLPDESLASPHSLTDSPVGTRSTRSASTASRSNRLSLTLPIMPATAYSARPAPATATGLSFPPTPLDTPSLMSPTDSTDFITAIAAHERRVLELREELSRAESDLAKLKKQFANHEAYKKRPSRRNVEPVPNVGAAAELQDEAAIRRSAEQDRRKALLDQLATPEKSRRRVLTGKHTRKLSLLSPLSPTKPDGESDEPEADFEIRSPPPLPSKRASWAARPPQGNGVKQLAEDLKSGIWTFMEDLRQATVGDEPITGHGTYMRGMDGNMRSTTGGANSGDQDTIRAKVNTRQRVASAFDEISTPSKQELENDGDSEHPSGVAARPPLPLRRSKTESGTRATKRFSWSPLTMDSYDDNDWSSWDSPGTSSPRWSGTTVNGDIIPSVPEKRDNDNNDPLSPL